MSNTNEVVIRNPGEQICVKYKGDFEKALNYEMVSGALAFEPFLAAVKQDVLGSERLAEAFKASPGSAVNALMMAAQCKLLPGGAYDLFYLIPRWNGRARRLEVQPMISYKGMCELAQRHPRVHKIEAFLVYKGEVFEFLPGEGRLNHKFGLDVDRSDENLIAAYARVVITDPSGQTPVHDDPVVWVMTRKELERARSRSDAYKGAESKGKKSSPWHTDFAMMCRKTVIRAVLTKGAVPRDMGVGGAIKQDDEADVYKPPVTKAVKGTVQSDIRGELGIDDKPEPFLDEDMAIDAIEQCEDQESLMKLRSRIEASGFDGDAVNKAYAEREFVLMPEEPNA